MPVNVGDVDIRIGEHMRDPEKQALFDDRHVIAPNLTYAEARGLEQHESNRSESTIS